MRLRSLCWRSGRGDDRNTTNPATTKTPNRSSRCLTPAAAPLRAKTNVPASSSTSSVPAAYALNPASVCRTCSAPDVGTISRYGASDCDHRHGHHQHVEQEGDRAGEPDVDVVAPSEEHIGQGDEFSLETTQGGEDRCRDGHAERRAQGGSHLVNAGRRAGLVGGHVRERRV